MKAPVWVGVIILLAVVLVVLISTGSHAAAGPTTSPMPSVAATAAHVTPVPSPEPLDVATGTMAHVALIGWLAALSILPLFALIGIALHARHRSRLVELDHPPLRRPEFVNRAFDVKALEARRGWLPESFTYSPHHRNDPVVEEEQPVAALPAASLTAEQMIAMPGLVYGERLDVGGPLVDHQVRSLLVGGVQGSGKSTFVALLAAQLDRMGARLSIGDPHASNPESLASRLGPLVGRLDVEEEPRMILSQVTGAYAELQRRKALGEAGDTRPYVAIVDEFPELVRLLNDRDLERLRVALEVVGGFSGRKFHVAVIVLGQSWMRSVIGSTAIRNLVTTAAVFRMRSDEARAMSGLRAEYWERDTLLLEPGEGYMCGLTSGAVRVRVPELPAHGSLMVPTGFPGPVIALPRGVAEPNGNPDGTQGSDLPPELPEHAVMALLAKGYDLGKVVTELTGVSRGRQYQERHLALQRWLVARMR